MAYSADGKTWTAVTNSIFDDNLIESIAWGNDTFIAVGRYGRMAYSSDGTSWTEVTNNIFHDGIGGIAWGNNRFVAGRSGGRIAYSSGGAVFTEKPFEINGVYEIIFAYSFLYNDVFLYKDGSGMRKIETEKLGERVTINNNKALFDNIEYTLYNGNGYTSGKKSEFLEYGEFLDMFGGMNYGRFNENIIGKDYGRKVKTMTMKDGNNEHYIYFADNKLIITIEVRKHKSEFDHLIKNSYFDQFFYIAERITE